eukprot:1160032-Pelagomonas_calceolata.AAC.7
MPRSSLTEFARSLYNSQWVEDRAVPMRRLLDGNDEMHDLAPYKAVPMRRLLDGNDEMHGQRA